MLTHSRQRSQQEALIVGALQELEDEEVLIHTYGSASPSHPMTTMPQTDPAPDKKKSMTDSEAQMAADEMIPKKLWHHPTLRSNYKLVIFSTLLTIMGTVLLTFGIVVLATPSSTLQGWVFLFAGLLCFIPGAYHVVYITCTICGRQGYQLENLPTFS